jgi:hypothetical protein
MGRSVARFLTFDRSTSRIQEVNSTTGVLAPVGPAIAGLETSALWDNRCTNVVALFRGDVYVVVRTLANENAVYKWDGAVMTQVFLSGVGVGVRSPWGLVVSNDVLYAFWADVGAPGNNVASIFTQDGTAWGPLVIPATSVVASPCAALTVWRQAAWIASEFGISPFNPFFALTGAFDGGNDAGLFDPSTIAGSFAYWDGDLYFMRPDTGAGPLLYQLASAWTAAVPVGAPAWTNQLATGLPSAGALVLAPDRGTYCLFRSKTDELVAFYSGASGTKIAKTDAASFPVFTDITTTVLPANIAALTNAGISLMEDDRRRANQLQSFAVRDTGLGNTHILSWDGSSASFMQTVASFTSIDLMPPNDQKADYRTYTAKEPSIEFDPTDPPTQPFPGRVTLPYIVKDTLSREIGILPEYSLDGDEWLPMTEGEGSDGEDGLTSSPTGEGHTFVWDAFNDLAGDAADMQMRIVPRITGV